MRDLRRLVERPDLTYVHRIPGTRVVPARLGRRGATTDGIDGVVFHNSFEVLPDESFFDSNVPPACHGS